MVIVSSSVVQTTPDVLRASMSMKMMERITPRENDNKQHFSPWLAHGFRPVFSFANYLHIEQEEIPNKKMYFSILNMRKNPIPSGEIFGD